MRKFELDSSLETAPVSRARRTQRNTRRRVDSFTLLSAVDFRLSTIRGSARLQRPGMNATPRRYPYMLH